MKKNKSYFNIGIVIIIAIIFLVTAIVGPLVINILYKKIQIILLQLCGMLMIC